MNRLPSHEALLAMFCYNPEDGSLTWRHRKDVGKAWNSRWAGKPAINCIAVHGYLRGRLGGKGVYQHRIIYKMMTGIEPPQIDHRDGCRSNNRWSNLYAATALDNARNVRMKPSNKSGRTGVHRNARGRWIAQIRDDLGHRHLGTFTDFDMACAVRADAEARIGFNARPR
jgi:hypothetical protein